MHTAEIAMTEGEKGLEAVRFELFRPILPMLASTAASVSRGGRELRSLVGRVEARRHPDPDPSPWRRGPHLHPQPQRHHAHAAGNRRRGAPPAGHPSGVRRRGALDERARPGRISGHRLADRQRGAARGDRDVPVRRPPRRRRGPPRHAARGALRAARSGRAAAQDPEPDHVGPRDGTAGPRRGVAGWTRRRRGEGRGVALLRGPSRQGLAQGEAGADLRPRRARRRVGPRAPPGLALEPPPRRPATRPAAGS